MIAFFEFFCFEKHEKTSRNGRKPKRSKTPFKNVFDFNLRKYMIFDIKTI